jgi:membrane-associated PAP2 superfamily phosphatase
VRTNPRARFLSFHLALPLALALGLLVLFETTDLDMVALDAAYDREAGRFPWRSAWITKVLLHEWAKYGVILFAVLLVGVLIAARWKGEWRPWRRRIVYVLLSMGIGTALTAWIKHVSGRYCPYELTRFGGWAPCVRLLESPVQVGKAGGCFPCGHASTAFSLVSIYFALRDVRPRAASLALTASLAFGFVLGAGRVVQGAHFPSHVFATSLLCWLVSLALYELLLPRAGSTAP